MTTQEAMEANNAATSEWELPVLEEIDVASITEHGAPGFNFDATFGTGS